MLRPNTYGNVQHSLLAMHLDACRDCGKELTYTYSNQFTQNVPHFIGAGRIVCNQCAGLYKPRVKCGEAFPRNSLEVVDQIGYVCPDCLEAGEFEDTHEKCESCDIWYASENMQEHAGEWYCEDCFHDNFSWCEQCEEYFPENGAIVIAGRRDTHVFCSPSCARDHGFERCDDCGDWHNPDNEGTVTASGNDICGECYDRHYFSCEDCGEVYHIEDAVGRDGSYYCESCDSGEEETSELHSYSYKPYPVFFPDFQQSAPFFGVELEVSGDKTDVSYTDINDAAGYVSDQTYRFLYCKEDGSLVKGFEIVSHPATLEHHKSIDYASLFSSLTSRGFRSHDANCSCGLHIHISRHFVGEDAALNMAELVYAHAMQFQKLGRRTNNQYAKFDFTPSFKEGLGIESAKEHVKYGSGNRYLALNFRNEKTIEIRFPKGTLKPETFTATLEMAHALATFSATSEAGYNRWSDFQAYCLTPGRYDFLPQYGTSKGVFSI